MPTLTVRETMWFSSECILPTNLSREAKEQRLNVSAILIPVKIEI